MGLAKKPIKVNKVEQGMEIVEPKKIEKDGM